MLGKMVVGLSGSRRVIEDLSFRRRPESRKFNELDPGLRRGDEHFSVSLVCQSVGLVAQG
jgi:hypothetical protein